MEEEDKEFFVLVLGVLAAIILVISWWFSSASSGVAIQAAMTSVQSADDLAVEPTDDDLGGSDDEAATVDAGDTVDGDGQAGTTETTDTDEAETPPSGDTDTSNQDEADDDEAAADEDAGADPSESDSTAAANSFDAIAADANLTVVRDLLRSAGLDELLAGGQPFTVFAPSNDAINQAASSDTLVSVLENDSETVLAYHIVPGTYTLDDLTELARGGRATALMTVQGESLELTVMAGRLLINGSAVVDADTIASDTGPVHVLDNVLLPPVASLNALVGLDPILFATGSADIEAESFATLDQLIEILRQSTVSVTVEGHTDSSGDALVNQNLSQSRARSVVNYLVANGVDESRLTAVGFGSDDPVADNNTDEGRALNRRIEFTLG